MKKHQTEQVIFEINTAEAGWLDFTITVGEQSFSDSFSHVFDPLPHLKAWLEAISLGVQQTSFTYNNEGELIKLDFNATMWNKQNFILSIPYQDDKIIIKNFVHRKQLVQAFYNAILDFSYSERYDIFQWEPEFIEKVLCLYFNKNKTELIEHLLTLDGDKLAEILAKAECYYGIISEFDIANQNNEWNLAKDYDNWNIDKKEKYIIDCLNEETYRSYDGMSLKEFRSPIIDNYLTEK